MAEPTPPDDLRTLLYRAFVQPSDFAPRLPDETYPQWAARAAEAAVLPAHRRQVLGEAADELDRIRDGIHQDLALDSPGDQRDYRTSRVVLTSAATGPADRPSARQAAQGGPVVPEPEPLHGPGSLPHGYVEGCGDGCNNAQCPAGETHDRCTSACLGSTVALRRAVGSVNRLAVENADLRAQLAAGVCGHDLEAFDTQTITLSSIAALRNELRHWEPDRVTTAAVVELLDSALGDAPGPAGMDPAEFAAMQRLAGDAAASGVRLAEARAENERLTADVADATQRLDQMRGRLVASQATVIEQRERIATLTAERNLARDGRDNWKAKAHKAWEEIDGAGPEMLSLRRRAVVAEAERDAAVEAYEDCEHVPAAEHADVLADRDRLADTLRRYEPVIEAAKAWRTGYAEGCAISKHDAVEQLLVASEALDDAGTDQHVAVLGDAGQLPDVGESGSNLGDAARVTLPADVARALFGVYETWWHQVGTNDPGRHLVSDGVEVTGVVLLDTDDDQAMEAACLAVGPHEVAIRQILGGAGIDEPAYRYDIGRRVIVQFCDARHAGTITERASSVGDGAPVYCVRFDEAAPTPTGPIAYRWCRDDDLIPAPDATSARPGQPAACGEAWCSDCAPDDELAEVDTTEEEIDQMMADGEPVEVVGPGDVQESAQTPAGANILTWAEAAAQAFVEGRDIERRRADLAEQEGARVASLTDGAVIPSEAKSGQRDAVCKCPVDNCEHDGGARR